MAPKDPEPSRITWCRALCPLPVFERPIAHVKLRGEIISVFSPQKGTSPKWDADGDSREGDSDTTLVLVSPRRQPRDPQARVTFVADVQPDEHGCNLLYDAGILQLAAVQRAHSGNFACEFANALSGFLVIAAND